MVVETSETTVQLDELVQRAESLREELADSGAKIDASGDDPSEAMQRCWEEGLLNPSIPRAYGGLSPDGGWTFGLSAVAEIVAAVSGIDGSIGQNIYTDHLALRNIFDPLSGLPDSTLRELSTELQERPLRFVSSNAESGSNDPVIARPISGGGIIVSGTKTFNTNSGAPGYANVGCRLEGSAPVQTGSSGNHHAIIPLDHPNVVMLDDWDNMGQKGTLSQTIRYEDVEVPSGWHYPRHPGPVGLRPMIHVFHGALMLGCGFGAMDACLRYMRKLNKPTMAQFGTAEADPLAHRSIGELTVHLLAAQALMRQTMRNIELLGESDAETVDIFAQAMSAKVACLEAGMATASTIFDLMGGRSTASKYGFDRFWRNIRTFAVHDPTDEKLVGIGSWRLTGEMPSSVLKIIV